MVKYVVIGGRGYIGAALFDAIPSEIDKLRTASSDSDGFQRIRLDSSEDFSRLQVEVGDIFFVTAAISSPDLCVREFDQAWAANVTGTSALISHVTERGGNVIFFSSDTVYGKKEQPFDERAECNPAGEYAKMKREIETRFADNGSFKSVRLSYVFSKDDKFTKYLSHCAQTGETADLFHPFYRAVVHRRDVIEGALALAESWDTVPERIINFGGPKVLSRIDMAEALRANGLGYFEVKISEPSDDFFVNRPQVISMKSPVLSRLLGRGPRDLNDAAQLEFQSVASGGVN